MQAATVRRNPQGGNTDSPQSAPRGGIPTNGNRGRVNHGRRRRGIPHTTQINSRDTHLPTSPNDSVSPPVSLGDDHQSTHSRQWSRIESSRGRSERPRDLPSSEESAPAFFNTKRRAQQVGNPKIARNTRAHIRAVALNIKGRGALTIRDPRHKWHEIHRMLYDEKIGIMAVSETHLSAAQQAEIEEDVVLGKRMKIYGSIDVEHPNSKGVAIVLNHDITNTVGVKVRRLIPGRAILATIPWHGKRTLTVLAIYAPADSMAENKLFWEKLYTLWMTEPGLPVPDIMLGDTNIVEDAADRFPHREDDAGAREALARFKQLIELKDGWRMTHPDGKAYTYSHTNGESHSRIDRVYVPHDLFKNCREWVIKDTPGNLSDHRLVSVDIHAPGAPYVGPGRYAIPLFILKDKKFIEFAVSEGAKLLEPMDAGSDENIQERYKKYKDRLREFARGRAKESVGATEQKKIKLQNARDRLLKEVPGRANDAASADRHREAAREVARLQAEINTITSRQRARNRMTTKIRYRNELDQITKFSVRVHKDTTPRDTMSYLQRTDVTPPVGHKRSDKMAELARDYHNDLQVDESEWDLGAKDRAIEETLNQMGQHTEPPDMADLSKELTEDEVLQSMKNSARGKASGIDGIPTELWIRLYEIFKNAKDSEQDGTEEPQILFDVLKLLTAVYNDIERFGVTAGTSFAHGWMCPIWKKKDVTDIANYRPITVLNTDYKIFTKALTEKTVESSAGTCTSRSSRFHAGP
ncbi:Endonuclease/exonuclease/phosphatase [Mycena crocata]|nr:Endonuclease/exonuclease/phosphatase [Mycena crocata]